MRSDPQRRILVIGGFGFYGERVCSALTDAGYAVDRGTRDPRGRERAVAFDLRATEHLGRLADYDAIVNCSDSVHAPPDRAIEHILAHGGTWFEMGADAVATRRLLDLDPGDAPKGRVVLGVGVFPGLSTALAKAVHDESPGCERLELGIRVSPLSGAGIGNCALMAESLFVPASRYEDGVRRVTRTAMGPTVYLPFGGSRQPSVNFALPDTELIAAVTGARSVTAYLSVAPNLLRFNFGALAWLAWALRPLRSQVVWALTWQLVLLRALLLRRVMSRVTLVAIADRGTEGERSRVLDFEEGHQATAEGVVAAVRAWERDPGSRRGVHSVAACWSLEALLRGLP